MIDLVWPCGDELAEPTGTLFAGIGGRAAAGRFPWAHLGRADGGGRGGR